MRDDSDSAFIYIFRDFYMRFLRIKNLGLFKKYFAELQREYMHMTLFIFIQMTDSISRITKYLMVRDNADISV